jgi:hypothetical protein
MVMVVSPASVNLNAVPEKNINRRTFIPLGEISDLTFVKDEFSPAELDVIKKTPFLASRIEAAADSGNIIGYRDLYKNDLAKLKVRQVYNFAINNPTAFLRSEFPAYLGSGNPAAASELVGELYKRGETPESIKVLYDESLPFASEYSTTASERRAINMATQGPSDPLGIAKYIKPFFTTVATIAGGPVGAAVMNSLFQVAQTGKIDPEETAKVAATAYVGQEVFGPTVPETSGVDYSLTGGGADAGGTGFQGSGTEGFTSGATPPPPTSLLDTGLGSINYNLLEPSQLSGIGETGLTLGAAGEGLQLPTVPALPSMGGGQGLVVPVEGGFVTETGFTPVGATPSLGDPDSFINDPEVLGQPVIQDVENLSLTDALRGLRLANQLMGGQQQAGVGVPQQQAPLQTAGVDYSGILGLLGQRTSVPGVQGLLGPAQIRYPSLLG